MKRLLLIAISTLCLTTFSHSQTLLAKWTFPTGTNTDSLADGGISANLTKGIHTEGGTSAIDFSKNGASTKAAQATGWDNGANAKCWVVQVTTSGFDQLTISSKQQSGGNNPGPRDWKVQYRIGLTGAWTDIPSTTLTVLNDWTTGILASVILPDACKNQDAVFFRWIMTSNTGSDGGTVAASGIDKIDDIYFYGMPMTGIEKRSVQPVVSIFPNPATDRLEVSSVSSIQRIEIFTGNGSLVLSKEVTMQKNFVLPVSGLCSGNYVVNVWSDNNVVTLKFVKK
jgi:hypothetical protein